MHFSIVGLLDVSLDKIWRISQEFSCHGFLPGLPSTERAHVALLFHKNSKDRLVPETEPGVMVEDFQ